MYVCSLLVSIGVWSLVAFTDTVYSKLFVDGSFHIDDVCLESLWSFTGTTLSFFRESERERERQAWNRHQKRHQPKSMICRSFCSRDPQLTGNMCPWTQLARTWNRPWLPQRTRPGDSEPQQHDLWVCAHFHTYTYSSPNDSLMICRTKSNGKWCCHLFQCRMLEGFLQLWNWMELPVVQAAVFTLKNEKLSLQRSLVDSQNWWVGEIITPICLRHSRWLLNMFRSPRHVMSGSPARRLQTELADLQQSKVSRRWPLWPKFYLALWST